MSGYTFYQVAYKLVRSSKPDGSGELEILDDKTERVAATDISPRGITVRDLYRDVKKGIDDLRG